MELGEANTGVERSTSRIAVGHIGPAQDLSNVRLLVQNEAPFGSVSFYLKAQAVTEFTQINDSELSVERRFEGS